MEKQFEIITKTRKNLIALTSELSNEKLNLMPPGFNNNIAWNLGHLVSSQQGLCYNRAGLTPLVTGKYFDLFRPGTKPDNALSNEEIDDIRALLVSNIDQLAADYKDNIFKNYVPWVNRYGVSISNIDEAIAYVIFHEGMHFGYVLALLKFVK